MDRLISEQEAIEAINDYWGEMETPTIDGYINAIKTIPSTDLDLKQSFKDGYDTALNDLEDRFEVLLNNNPWYANTISDILQVINEQKGSDYRCK